MDPNQPYFLVAAFWLAVFCAGFMALGAWIF